MSPDPTGDGRNNTNGGEANDDRFGRRGEFIRPTHLTCRCPLGLGAPLLRLADRDKAADAAAGCVPAEDDWRESSVRWLAITAIVGGCLVAMTWWIFLPAEIVGGGLSEGGLFLWRTVIFKFSSKGSK